MLWVWLVLVAFFCSAATNHLWFHILRVRLYYSRTHVRRSAAAAALPEGGALPPPPVGVVQYVDHRDSRPSASGGTARSSRPGLRVVSWNIEFSYCMQTIITELVQIDADVILLQECDSMVHKGNVKNCIDVLARALKMNGVFCAHHAYSSGVWGCAVLTRHGIGFMDVRFLMLEHIPSYPRSSLAVRIQTPFHGDVIFCSVHLEVCCGLTTRIAQTRQVMEWVDKEWPTLPKVLGGDLNTIGHSLLRLSPFHCNDRYRAMSFGRTEAQMMENILFKLNATWRCDSFDKVRDFTFRNAVVTAKLDWFLYHHSMPKPSRERVQPYDPIRQGSDHQYIVAEWS